MSAPVSPVLERLLRYVRYDTQSNEHSASYPSTAGQLTLLRDLAAELTTLGASDVVMDAHGYVTATVPATSTNPDIPTIGFIAHVDTSPEMSGAGVTPLVHHAWNGDDIVTASGTTLLGADNKAGVAEIMTAVAHMLAHPEIPHGRVRVAFTPDEEIGRGTQHFDVAAFGARFAYTMDGGSRGSLECESFAADAMTVTFHGFNTHPGYARGRMVNAIKVAADFITRLPDDAVSPETTSGYEGFVHPYAMQAGVDRTTVRFIVRDFSVEGLAAKEQLLEALAREAAEAAGVTLDTTVEEQYRNMREVVARHPEVVDHAREAIRRAGLVVQERPIRGGTDGSRLSFMGLPTPNLFAGEQNFHSRLEWVSVQDMEKAVEVILHLVRIWAETA
jgi:tripeptide aminopeptidase